MVVRLSSAESLVVRKMQMRCSAQSLLLRRCESGKGSGQRNAFPLASPTKKKATLLSQSGLKVQLRALCTLTEDIVRGLLF